MTRTDPHLNLFHAYRGPVAPGAAEAQLEDNLTRALGITLEKLANPTARATLLAALGVTAEQADRFLRFELQVSRPSPDWPPPTTRRLATITGVLTRNSHAPTAAIDDLGTGRADGVVVMGGCVVALESKLGNAVSAAQLQAHRKSLSIVAGPVYAATWNGVARAARAAVAAVAAASTDAFLLDQLREYLQLNGYGGLTYDHFAYFALSADDRARMEETKEGLRRALNGIMIDLRKGLNTEWDIHLGSVRKGGADTYAALKPTPAKSGQLPHLSLTVTAAGVAIFANIETVPAHSAFLAAWKSRSQAFVQVLLNLQTDDGEAPESAWRLKVVYRIPSGQPRDFRTETKLDIGVAFVAELGELAYPLLSRAFAKSGGATPEIMLVREYPAPKVIATEDLTATLVADATALKPFFEWVGFPIA